MLLCNFGTIAHARLHFAVADKEDFNQSMQGALNGRAIRAAASTISYDLQIGYSQATDQARVLTRKFITLKKHSTWKLTPSFRTLRDAAWLRLRLAIISRGEQVRVGERRGVVQTNDPQAEDLVRSHATKLNISRAFNLRV